MNNLSLAGRLTKPAVLRHTQTGIAVAQATLAVERPYTNQQGEREADFINIVAWRKTAETLSNFTTKGSLIGITGRIQTRNYQNDAGATIYVTEAVVENLTLLEPKEVTDKRRQEVNQNRNEQGQDGYSNQQNNYLPKKQQQPNNSPFQSNDTVNISDEDLPF